MSVIDFINTNPNEMSIVQLAKYYANCRAKWILDHLAMKDRQLSNLISIYGEEISNTFIEPVKTEKELAMERLVKAGLVTKEGRPTPPYAHQGSNQLYFNFGD